jgi:hypothetical protein
MIKENPRYKIWKYNNKDSENQRKNYSSEKNSVMHQEFYINGEFCLEGLEKLTKGTNAEWKKLHPTLPEHRTEPEETLVYSNSNAILLISADYAKKHHKVDLTLKNYSEENPKLLENLRATIEKSLNCKLNNKDETSDLITKLDLESN